MENTAIKVELPISYGKQPITVYLPNAGHDHPGIAAFDKQYFDIGNTVMLKLSDPLQRTPGVVVSNYNGDIIVANSPETSQSATSKNYVDLSISTAMSNKLDKAPSISGSFIRLYGAGPNSEQWYYEMSSDPIAFTVARRGTGGVLKVGRAVLDDDAVNLSLLREELEKITALFEVDDALSLVSENPVKNSVVASAISGLNEELSKINGTITRGGLISLIGPANLSESGLMSAVDKGNLDTLMSLVGEGVDDDTVVNKLREVLAVFSTFDEEVNLVQVLDSKLDKMGAGATNRLYGVTAAGVFDPISYTTTSAAWTIPMREAGGSVVVGTPTSDSHAATKKYVDDAIPDTSTFLTKMDNDGGYYIVYLNGNSQGIVKANTNVDLSGTVVMRYDDQGNIMVPLTPSTNDSAASKYYVDTKALPAVTGADNGAFLRVVSGVWTKSQVLSATGVSF